MAISLLSAITTLTRFSASSSSASINFKYIFSRRTVSTASPKRQKQRGCKIMASTSPVPETYSATQDKITAPYGSWKSPLTADVVSGASKRLGGTAVDGHGRLIWLESRPTEAGYAETTELTTVIRTTKIYDNTFDCLIN